MRTITFWTMTLFLTVSLISACTKSKTVNKVETTSTTQNKTVFIKKEKVVKTPLVKKKVVVKKVPVKKPQVKVVEKSIWEKPVAKLPAKEQAIFDSLKGAPLTKKYKRVDDQHYYKGNETRYDLWYKYIKDLGGAYVGVGPDQNYSFIGVAKSKLVVLMDYDIHVLSTHRMYMLLTKHATKPSQVYEWLKRKYKKKVAKWADAEYSKEDARWVKIVHNGAGNFIRKHHYFRLRRAKRNPKVQYWLSSQVIFDHWKKLVEANRIKLVLGDLRIGKTMTEIGDILKKLKIKTRVQYFSNAEEFWYYTPGFKKAAINMPYDNKTIILRSVVLDKKYSIGFKFHYTIQYAKDFLEWMHWKGKALSKHIAKIHRIPLENTLYLSRLPGLPADAKKDVKTEK
jgi:hypothetical protein